MQGFAVTESLVYKLSKFEFKTKSKLSVVTRSKYYKKWYHGSAILNVICLFIALHYFFFDLDLFQTPKTFLVIFRTFWKWRPTERKKKCICTTHSQFHNTIVSVRNWYVGQLKESGHFIYLVEYISIHMIIS